MPAPHVIQGRETELLALHVALDTLSKRGWFSFLPAGGDLLFVWPHLGHIHLYLHGLASGTRDKAHTARQVLSAHRPTCPIFSPSVFPGCSSQRNLVSHSQLLNPHHSTFYSPHSMGRDVGLITDERRNQASNSREREAPSNGCGRRTLLSSVQVAKII